ncbi:uncharacterized [Tachysurus ichikawai]
MRCALDMKNGLLIVSDLMRHIAASPVDPGLQLCVFTADLDLISDTIKARGECQERLLENFRIHLRDVMGRDDKEMYSV